MADNATPGKLNAFLDSTAGKIVAGCATVALLVVIYLVVRPRNPAGDLARGRVFICTETNKPFKVTLEEGMMIPVKSPYSGKNTGYPAELCYWTPDGQVAKEPHAVLVKKSIDPSAGPTFCPTCGRLVVMHNPPPTEGKPPPPTEQEYKSRRHGSNASTAP
jgi:hypothetical protein